MSDNMDNVALLTDVQHFGKVIALSFSRPTELVDANDKMVSIIDTVLIQPSSFDRHCVIRQPKCADGQQRYVLFYMESFLDEYKRKIDTPIMASMSVFAIGDTMASIDDGISYRYYDYDIVRGLDSDL